MFNSELAVIIHHTPPTIYFLLLGLKIPQENVKHVLIRKVEIININIVTMYHLYYQVTDTVCISPVH